MPLGFAIHHPLVTDELRLADLQTLLVVTRRQHPRKRDTRLFDCLGAGGVVGQVQLDGPLCLGQRAQGVLDGGCRLCALRTRIGHQGHKAGS